MTDVAEGALDRSGRRLDVVENRGGMGFPGSGTESSRWRVTVLSATAVLLAGCVAAAVAAVVPSRTAATGIPDAGGLVELGLPALKAIFDVAAALTVGWLVAAAALVPPARSGLLDVGGFRAVRAAGLSAVVWAVAGLALIPVSLADLGPYPLTTALRWDYVLSGLQASESMRGYLFSAGLASLIAILSRVVLRPRWAAWLLVVAVVAVLPLAVAGHASASGDHDIAVDSMVFHLVGVSVWVGGLVAFLGLARQQVTHLNVVARRYSSTALVAFVAVALSGVVNTWIRLTFVSDLWTTPYGRLVLIKTLALVVLGVIGYAHRRRTLPDLAAGRRGALIRLAAVETLILVATVGVAAGLARTAPPPPAGVLPSAQDARLIDVLGFSLAGPPTPARLLFDWRFDLVFGTAAMVAGGLYLAAVLRLRRRGERWPAGRTVAWCAGWLTVAMATSSGLGRYAPSQFSLHMLEQVLLGSTAPILLVLAAPGTLLLRSLIPRRDGVPGLREAAVAVGRGPVLRVLTHPLVVLGLFAGSGYAIYFTGVYPLLVDSHLGHLAMSGYFLLLGYLFYWVVIGVDPTPRRLSPSVKPVLVLVALPFHALFGLALATSPEVLAATYYRSLDLPWAGDPLTDQHTGGGIAWGIPIVGMLVVLVALLARRADADHDPNADLRNPGFLTGRLPDRPTS